MNHDSGHNRRNTHLICSIFFFWINAQIKGAMRLRNKLYKKYRRYRTDDSWECYRLQRNLVSKLKRTAIKRFCSDSAANATTPGGFWKRMKSLLPCTGHGTSQQDMHLLDGGKVVIEPSNLINAFFSTPILDQTVLALTHSNARGLSCPPKCHIYTIK